MQTVQADARNDTITGDVYIGPDPERPDRRAVWEIPKEGGRHRVVADDFKDRRAAERWIDFQRSTGGIQDD